MSTYFDKAFIVLDDVPSIFVNYDFSTNRLFDFAIASSNIETSNALSNNKDSLYNKSILYTL